MVRINDCNSFDRFYFDLLVDVCPMNDFKFVELYSVPYFFNKDLSTGPEITWEKNIDQLLGQVNVQESYLTQNISTSDKE